MIKKMFMIILLSCMWTSTAYASPNKGSDFISATNSNATKQAGISTTNNVNSEEPIIATASNAVPNSHSAFISLEDTDDFQEIKNLENEIVAQANIMLHGYEDPVIVTKDDIDWNTAVKLYSQSPELFEDAPDMERYYTETGYIWVLPIYVNDITLEITFNKGLEVSENARELLSDEAIEKLEASVGKWEMIGGRFIPKTFNYKSDIEQTMHLAGIPTDCHSFILSGLIGISMPMVVTVEDGQPMYIFPALKSEQVIFANRTNAGKKLSRANTAAFIYSFNDVAQVVIDNLANLKDGVLALSDISYMDIDPIISVASSHVKVNGTRFRSRPSSNAVILGLIYAGETILMKDGQTITDSNGNTWVQIERENGQIGWVEESLIS